MGKRDFRQHEAKKPKKDEKKALAQVQAMPRPEPEVIRKPRAPREEEA